MRNFWRNNSLSIVLFGIFFGTIVGMSVVGWRTAQHDAQEHASTAPSYTTYVASGDFIEGVFENWESEFLQMWALVVLTIFLRQKGAVDSKPPRKAVPQDTHPRLRLLRHLARPGQGKAVRYALYAHSLGLALLLLFVVSFTLHAIGGTHAYNDDATEHHQPTVSTVQYMQTSQFWYESLQNWQSEFLAVGTLTVLSIKLRERGSPESKPLGTSHDNQVD